MSKRREFQPTGFDALEERLVLSNATTLQNLASFQANNGLVLLNSVLAQNEAYIQSLYTFIGRSPNPGGVDFHAVRLTHGQVNRLQVAETFLNTTDFHNAETTYLYQFLLDRAPEPGALSAWNNYLNGKGHSFITEAAAILASPEFFNNAGGTNAGFIDAVYEDIFDRDAEGDPGAQDWINVLNSGALSRNQVALDLLRSPEGASNLVALAYSQVLQRGTDPLSQPFVVSIEGGGTFENVVAALLASPEYFNGVQLGILGDTTFGQLT
jgi:hypothetical protein